MKGALPYLILLLLGLPPLMSAQPNTLKGTVEDAERGDPLPGANVFVDGTFIGAQTDSAGSFILREIPDGTRLVVFSFMGYKRQVRRLTFPLERSGRLEVQLEPDTLLLDEISVTADDPREWRRNLERFKKYFLGFTRNARQTRILNPEVLDFETENGVFTAEAVEPLEVDNRALGYHVRYFLERFELDGSIMRTHGYSMFSMLDGDERQHSRWAEERLRAYHGSYRHFIDALVKGRLKDDGFEIFYSNKLEYMVNAHTLKLDNLDEPRIEYPNRLFLFTGIGRMEFAFHQPYTYLRVDYLEEEQEPEIVLRAGFDDRYHQISYLQLPREKAVIDPRSGYELAPYRALLHGYWGWTSRLPDLLPAEYDPAF